MKVYSELEVALLEKFTTAGLPTATEGRIVYDTTTGTVKVGNGSTWDEVGVGGGGGGALAVTGSRGTPQSISATGIAFTGADARQMWFVQGNAAGVVDVTANPQIAAAGTVGQELILIGRNDAQAVLLEDGTGLSLNGPMELYADSVLSLVWDGTNWVELYRR